MKKLNIILFALCCLTSFGYAQQLIGNKAPQDKNLQSKGHEAPEGYKYQRGDTVIIKKDAINYLTGERMSNWVYGVRHIVARHGSPRFQDGVLIQDIMSWVPADGLLLNTPVVLDTNGKAVYKQDTVHVDREVVRTVHDTILQTKTVHDTAYVHDTVSVVYSTRYGINRLSLGVRGGLASLMHGTNAMKDNLGFDVYFDLQYAHYWKQGDKAAMGILTGVGVGFLRGGLHGNIDDKYQTSTDGGQILYNITAQEVREKQDQVMVDVPLMFSIVTDKGFFFNVGPKVSFPVWSRSKMNFTEPHVDALFVEEGVSVRDRLITGVVPDGAYKDVVNWKHPVLNVLLGGEIGYEFKFKNGHALGLGLYGDYGVYSLYKNESEAQSIVNITPPSNSAPASVKIESPSDVYTSKMSLFDVGLKLTYHIQWQKIRL